MANEGILLKNNNGEDVAYYGVENITVRTTEDGVTQSGQQNFAKGEAIEGVEISLSLNDGDQMINAPEGKLVKSAIIKKPDTLVPENIVKGIKIAGVEGTHEGGGGGGGGDAIEYYEEPWVDDVCFWDLDGNLILNVPMSELSSLESLPTPPEYDGLTFVRWNYTLEQIRATEYPLDIGPLYKPTDGKTHVKLNITESSYKIIILNFQQTVDGGVSIDWGDSSDVQTVSGTGQVSATHSYSAIGEYEITLSVVDGCIMSPGSSASTASKLFVAASSYSYGYRYVTEIYFGDGVELINYSCCNLQKATRIIFPVNMTSIPASLCISCYKLPAIIIPDGVTSIGNSAFSNVRSTSKLTSDKRFLICCLPESVTSIGSSAFTSSYYLIRFVVPKNVIALPDYMLNSQGRLCRLFLPRDKVASVGRAFVIAPLLRENSYPRTDVLETLGTYYMKNNKVIKSYTIPTKVSTIPMSAFEGAALEELVIPQSVTSVESFVAANASNLKRIIVCGSNITSVNSYAFSDANAKLGMDYIFYSETPPPYDVFRYLLGGGINTEAYQRVYVPDTAISAYETMLGTNGGSLELCPLSEYKGSPLPDPC